MQGIENKNFLISKIDRNLFLGNFTNWREQLSINKSQKYLLGKKECFFILIIIAFRTFLISFLIFEQIIFRGSCMCGSRRMQKNL